MIYRNLKKEGGDLVNRQGSTKFVHVNQRYGKYLTYIIEVIVKTK